MAGHKILRISEQLLVEVFGTGPHPQGYKVLKGLPLDARIISTFHNPYTYECGFIVFSEEFAPIPVGGVMEALTVEMEVPCT